MSGFGLVINHVLGLGHGFFSVTYFIVSTNFSVSSDNSIMIYF